MIRLEYNRMGRPQDFSKSVIYHIRHMESKEVVYVGSTTNFPQRKRMHKYSCNNEEGKDFRTPIYCHIRNNGGFDCFEVIPIKSLKLENKTELLIAEQEEMDKHRTLANGQKAYIPIDIEEKRIYNNEINKKWCENNTEKMKQHRQEQKQPVKCPICNSTVTRCQLKRHQRTKKCQEYLNK